MAMACQILSWGTRRGISSTSKTLGDRRAPAFVNRGYLEAGGRVIRHMAGPNGSVQGPAEAKWGYTNPSVADWDLDGDLDILVNDIRGEVVCYPNIGSNRFG